MYSYLTQCLGWVGCIWAWGIGFEGWNVFLGLYRTGLGLCGMVLGLGVMGVGLGFGGLGRDILVLRRGAFGFGAQ